MRRSRGGRHAYFLAKVPVCQPTFVDWVFLFCLKKARSFEIFYLLGDCSRAPRSGTKPNFSCSKTGIFSICLSHFCPFFFLGLGLVRFWLVGLGCAGYAYCQKHRRVLSQTFICCGTSLELHESPQNQFFSIKKLKFLTSCILHFWPFFSLCWVELGWDGFPCVCVLPETQTRSSANLHLLRECSGDLRSGTNPNLFARKFEFLLLSFSYLWPFFSLLGLGWVWFEWVGFAWISPGVHIAWNTCPFLHKLQFAAALISSSTKRHKTNYRPVRSKTHICCGTARELYEAAQNQFSLLKNSNFPICFSHIWPFFFLGWVGFGCDELDWAAPGMRFAWKTGPCFRKLAFAAGLLVSSMKRLKANFFARKLEFLTFCFSHFPRLPFAWAA